MSDNTIVEIDAQAKRLFPRRMPKFPSDMASDEINISDLIGVLRRRYKIIMATILTICALAALVSFTLTPLYTSSALVIVDTSRKNLLDASAQLGVAAADNARVESEVEILRSDNVLVSVIANQNLIADPEFGVSLSSRDKLLAFFRVEESTVPSGQEALAIVLNKLRDATTIRRRGLTYLISVEVESRSPEKASVLANAIANAYIASQLEAKVVSALMGRDTIIAQSEAARKSVIEAENQLGVYLTNNIARLAQLTGRSDLTQIRDAIESLTKGQRAAGEQISTLKGGLQEKNWGSLVNVLESDAAKELVRQRETLAVSIAGATAGSATKIDLESELAGVEQQLEKAAEKRLGELNTTLQSSTADLERTRQQFITIVGQTTLPADVLAEIYQLQQNSRNATNNYQLLLSRAQDLETQAAVQIADSRLISSALVPSSPSFPNKRLLLGLALLLAIGIGTGLAFLYELFIGGFTSAEQLQAVTGTNVVAILPKRVLAPASNSVADTVVDHQLSAYSEEIRRLRSSLDQRMPLSEYDGDEPKGVKALGRVFMVSSALPGEGKSTVALSLARTYAADGYHTLLIDCDLRRPSIHKQLGLEPTTGLADYLRGSTEDQATKSLIANDSKTPLTVILGSRPAKMATDQLITQRKFASLMQSTREKFDFIILDTPPIDPVVDGTQIAKHVDAAVFVVKWASSSQKVVVSSIERIAANLPQRAELLSVLNQVDQKNSSSYRYGGYYVE